ncbi:RhoGAP-domain-containing protein [Lichtheimia hyalospora FSU 10163]|nr:RhoGAP-domain-containing protein [Lichtheimia hyalospora FSU 10163]
MSPPECSSTDASCCDQLAPPCPTSTLYCTKCQHLIEGEYVRALDGTFHWDCFSCLDCNEPVASRFFPIEVDHGVQQPLCERDYFRRLNLVCESCGDALRGPYITAVGKKFHLEHFCCSACSVVFGPEDSYYEHDNNVYCHYHYSIKFAIQCSGCETAILKQFVEIPRNNIDEHWHPECYMIHKFWNVKVAQDGEQTDRQDRDVTKMTIEELRDSQIAMEDKVYRIWTVLSAFEESAAACISDMLIHVSQGSYGDGLRMADYFVTHVEVLFAAIDDLVSQYHAKSLPNFQHERESRMLCRKIINFFTLLSQTQETGLRRMGITEDLLSLVTRLAHFLKGLIRVGLKAALKLEAKQQDTKSIVISRFLSQLVELANKQRYTSSDLDSPLATDQCHACDTICDDQCYRLMHMRWHDRCFACSKCCAPLRDEYESAFWDTKQSVILCKLCTTPGPDLKQGFERVSQLQQFSFLLRFTHRRLYKLLGLQDTAPVQNHPPANVANAAAVMSAATHPPANNDEHTSKDGNAKETIHLGDIKRVKSTSTGRKLTDSRRIAKRSTLMETPSPNTAYVANQGQDDSVALEAARTAIPTPSPSDSGDARTTTQTLQQPRPPMHTSVSAYAKVKPVAKFTYIAELSALNHFMVKHIAVLYLEDLLKDHFTLEELVDLIDEKKNSTLWGKFVTSLRAGGNKKSKEGTFGVPLDMLIEKNGAESNLGAGPSRIRIPTFIDDSISAMKRMDMSVEGIFRKNGNIRRLKELSDEMDANPNNVHLSNETPVQVAALIKKFLRELPEPLLTYKLYKLFTVVNKIQSEQDRKRVLHLACCLLPKPNRDTMEVLFLFLKWVATFAETEDGNGSKMDLMNIATVLAPNVLYSKNKDPLKDELFSATVIDTIHMLLQYQEEFCAVPEDIIVPLQNLSFDEEDMEASARDVLRKCEEAMQLKRSRVAGELGPPPSMPPRQNSSPAAIMTVAATSTDETSSPKRPDLPVSSPIDIRHHHKQTQNGSSTTMASPPLSATPPSTSPTCNNNDMIPSSAPAATSANAR